MDEVRRAVRLELPNLFFWKELDLSKVCDRFEVRVCGDENMAGGIHCKFQSKRIGISNPSVDAQLGRSYGAFSGGRHDLDLRWNQAVQNSLLIRRTQSLSQIPSNLAPLHR